MKMRRECEKGERGEEKERRESERTLLDALEEGVVVGVSRVGLLIGVVSEDLSSIYTHQREVSSSSRYANGGREGKKDELLSTHERLECDPRWPCT